MIGQFIIIQRLLMCYLFEMAGCEFDGTASLLCKMSSTQASNRCLALKRIICSRIWMARALICADSAMPRATRVTEDQRAYEAKDFLGSD